MLRFLGFLVVVAALLAALGFWRGWFAVSAAPGAGNKTGITFTMDGDQLQADADALGAQLRALSQRVALEVDAVRNGDHLDATVAGPVENGVLSLDVGARAIAVPVDADVPVTQEGRPIALEQLATGDDVRLRFVDRGDDLVLVGIERR